MSCSHRSRRVASHTRKKAGYQPSVKWVLDVSCCLCFLSFVGAGPTNKTGDQVKKRNVHSAVRKRTTAKLWNEGRALAAMGESPLPVWAEALKLMADDDAGYSGRLDEYNEHAAALGEPPYAAAPRMSCDQCSMVSINGQACHETGCPNFGDRWNGEEWVSQRDCFVCGATVDADNPCCDAEDEEEWMDEEKESELWEEDDAESE